MARSTGIGEDFTTASKLLINNVETWCFLLFNEILNPLKVVDWNGFLVAPSPIAPVCTVSVREFPVHPNERQIPDAASHSRSASHGVADHHLSEL